jgi:hypothetical protein
MNPQPKDKWKPIPKSERSLAQLKKDLDKVFNKYIRQRDALPGGVFKCISCGQIKSLRQMNAGHYYSAGHHSALRWNEVNVNGQCVFCNKWLHSNSIQYRKGLIEKYDHIDIHRLEFARNNKSKMMRFEILFLITHYKLKIKKQKQ